MQAGIVADEIPSGEFGDAAAIQDYRFECLGEMLVERVIWGRAASSHAARRYGGVRARICRVSLLDALT